MAEKIYFCFPSYSQFLFSPFICCSWSRCARRFLLISPFIGLCQKLCNLFAVYKLRCNLNETVYADNIERVMDEL
uniref:Uncharacterized protein n=1 Tax=Rhizophora mucronata TaxID=61149 RepID=A0A2P2QZR5_RHIMU